MDEMDLYDLDEIISKKRFSYTSKRQWLAFEYDGVYCKDALIREQQELYDKYRKEIIIKYLRHNGRKLIHHINQKGEITQHVLYNIMTFLKYTFSEDLWLFFNVKTYTMTTFYNTIVDNIGMIDISIINEVYYQLWRYNKHKKDSLTKKIVDSLRKEPLFRPLRPINILPEDIKGVIIRYL